MAACSTGTAGHPAAASGTSRAPASSPSIAADATSAPAEQAGFASALAAWNTAATAPAATRNTYLQQAADDLQTAGNSSYQTAISDLQYLANLPATNDTSAQQATAHSDVEALDTFFGTPGQLT